MKTHPMSKLALSAIFCGLAPAALAAPVLTGQDVGRPECRQAQQIGTAKFRSHDFSISGPIALPKDISLRWGLHVLEEDISGGDGLEADPAYFSDRAAKAMDDNRIRHVYWQDNPSSNSRLVVVDRAFNWRGDWYSLYVLDPKVTPQALVADLSAEGRAKMFKPLIEDSWQPPQVLIPIGSGAAWVLEQDATAVPLAGWTVYADGADGFSARCTVNFMPKVRHPVSLLPRPAQRFAALLTEALGPGNDEGTLHPTAMIQDETDTVWANAILRPWALKNVAYNSRAEVDAGLKQWAAVNPRRRALYTALLRQYPRTQAVLAARYRSHFHLTPRQASAMARYATDVIFRDYFVFPSEEAYWARYDPKRPVAPNPWPK